MVVSESEHTITLNEGSVPSFECLKRDSELATGAHTDPPVDKVGTAE